ncbi:MAG TPA: hypothetical protein VGK48_19070 [Terriglobia bacterium]|jgi:hypothetical protein
MNQNLILQLIEVAIALAQTQLEPGDTASTLAGIVQRAVAAYEASTGQPLDPLLIKVEAPL